MTTRVYIPRDAAALALGADSVAAFLRQAADVEIVRTGSRGLLWLEPMVEVATPEGRITSSDLKLIETRNGSRIERKLSGDAEWRATLRELFRIDLPA